ncbi:MAG: hypothetical protein RIS64_4614, partial [Bacteroidota bacterium]
MKNFIKPILGFQWLCLLCLCGTTATAFAQTENWTNYFGNSMVSSIAIDSQGNKWFGTQTGVWKFDGTNYTHYHTSNSGLVDNGVAAIAIDAQGNKWFGTHTENTSGISKFDGTTWTTYLPSNSGLTNSKIRSIAIDAQGNKWFGTWGGGV